MDWKEIHHWAEEATMWSQLFINAWLILTAISVVVSNWAKRKLSQFDILVLAGLSFLLIAWAFAGGFSWWFLVEGMYEQKFGPMPTAIQVMIFAIPTIYTFWYYGYIFKQQIGKR